MRYCKNTTAAIHAVFLIVAAGRSGAAEPSFATYEIGPADVNCGGTHSTGGAYALNASTAQVGGVGAIAQAAYELNDGFWHATTGFDCSGVNECSGHGTCVGPDECLCDDGWSGPDCSDGDCGDALILGMEECDDGGVVDGDGCSSTCMIENGWDCTGEPSVCTPAGIPAISSWGITVMVLLVLGAATVAFKRLRVA